ncbi:MAG: hypothetical protein EU550_00270 [Promethearchaeota archaeon]|nr:MAG: hypothetical protein EU550_00270 [Candidatus Lokiarchaeota archaeon]
MEKNNIDKFFSLIHAIERKNNELDRFLKNLDIKPRSSLLKEIHKAIINQNEFLRSMDIQPKNDICQEDSEDKTFFDDIIDLTISNIEKNPAKKVFYLRKFLDKFEDISENDKNAIIQSLKNVELENLKSDFESLAKIFEIKL